jgi:hypothetical protein
MSDKAIVTTRTATDLLAAGAEDDLRSMTAKLMRLTPGGRKLSTDNAANLAVYCFMTDLNPFNGEAYWVDGAGPIPGVAGVRRKALEYLAITSTPDDRFFVEFRDAQPGEASYDPDKGDIAKHATLRIRSVSEHHQQNIMRIFAELVQAGVDSDVAWDRAERLGGSEPLWTACGVVDHRESFSREAGTKGPNDKGTVDKWDRHQRAEKRAEKWVIRKAFPSVLLPDIELGDASHIDATIVDAIVRDVSAELASPPAPRPEGVILEELGYTEPSAAATEEPEPDKPESEPVPEGNGPEPEHKQQVARSWEPEFVKVLMEDKIAQHPKQAVAILNMLQPGTVEEAALLGQAYRGHRDKGEESEQAALLTLQGVSP